MNFIEVFQNFGFPVACVISLGLYIAKVQNESRADSKEREERLLGQLSEMSNTNKLLLETNTILAKDVEVKLDKVLGLLQH